MRVCLSFASGKLVWSDTTTTENEAPPEHMAIPIVVPGKGFGQVVFDFCGVMHTQNENSYLLYGQRRTEATQ